MRRNSAIKLLLLLSFFLHGLSQEAYAKNFMLIMGGGGEEPGKKTIFDHEMKTLGNSLANKGWEYDILYNGGHEESEALVKSHFSKAGLTNEFTEKSYDDVLAIYKNKIISGEIKEDDQLMIILNSHSAPNNGTQETQSIAVKGKVVEQNDGRRVYQWNVVDLDKIKELMNLAEEKGVKLGIASLGCYSGLAMNLNAKKTCIVSSTGHANFSYHGPQSFTNLFLKEIGNGGTLEEIFLKARVSSTDAGSPMIITTEGQKASWKIYQMLKDYIKFNDAHYPVLGIALNNHISTPEGPCNREKEFKELIKMVSSLEGIATAASVQKLKDALHDYKKYQDGIIAKVMAAKNAKSSQLKKNVKVKFASEDRKIKGQMEMSIDELMNIDADALVKQYESLKSNEYASRIAVYKAIGLKQQELLKSHPEFITHKFRMKEILMAVGNSQTYAKNVMMAEKVVFAQIYNKDNSEGDLCDQIHF